MKIMATNPPGKFRILVDANVLFAGTLWPRFPYEVLQHAVSGDYQLLLSPRIITEARVAITRVAPSATRRFADLLLATRFEVVQTPVDEEIAAHPNLVRDLKDIHVALAAINANADYLVTQDKDLTEASEPIHQYVSVLLPGTFLRQHMGWTSEALEAIRHRTWDDLAT